MITDDDCLVELVDGATRGGAMVPVQEVLLMVFSNKIKRRLGLFLLPDFKAS
jgi:hypothetical protein